MRVWWDISAEGELDEPIDDAAARRRRFLGCRKSQLGALLDGVQLNRRRGRRALRLFGENLSDRRTRIQLRDGLLLQPLKRSERIVD